MSEESKDMETFYELMNHEGYIRTYDGIYKVELDKYIDDKYIKLWYSKYTYELKKEIKTEKGTQTKTEYKSYIDDWLRDTEHNLDNPVYNIKFDPSLPIGGNPALNIFNTFSGFMEPKENGNIEPILKHIKEVWANDDENVYNYLIQWMAHIFQKPETRNNVAIGLRSKEGTGKSLIIEKLLGGLLGNMFLMQTDLNAINGDFNNQLENKLLVNFNEIGWVERNDVGKLKSYITDDGLEIRRKRKDPKYVKNYMNIIFSTNDDRIVSIKNGSRRWLLLNPSEKYIGNKEYFNTLVECIEKEKTAFLGYLLNVDLSNFNPADYPHTEEEETQKILSFNSMEAFTYSIKNKEIEWTDPAILMRENNEVKANVLYDEYTQWCKNNGFSYVYSSTAFGKYMGNIFFKNRKTNGVYYLIEELM